MREEQQNDLFLARKLMKSGISLSIPAKTRSQLEKLCNARKKSQASSTSMGHQEKTDDEIEYDEDASLIKRCIKFGIPVEFPALTRTRMERQVQALFNDNIHEGNTPKSVSRSKTSNDLTIVRPSTSTNEANPVVSQEEIEEVKLQLEKFKKEMNIFSVVFGWSGRFDLLTSMNIELWVSIVALGGFVYLFFDLIFKFYSFKKDFQG